MRSKLTVVNKKDIVGYILEISEELAVMADSTGEGVLAYILRQAVEETKLILEKV